MSRIRNFPSFSEGLSLRHQRAQRLKQLVVADFPSFSEGLSLRPGRLTTTAHQGVIFPFLFGGTFIEAA